MFSNLSEKLRGIEMLFDYTIRKAIESDELTRSDLVYLLSLPSDSIETRTIISEANQISKDLSNGKAEIHAQLSLNSAICFCDCSFCRFSNANGIISDSFDLSIEDAVQHARQLETEGANAIYLGSTAQYPIENLLETACEIRRTIKSQTAIYANIGDQSLENAIKLKDAGFTGVYHALRLREGIDTEIVPFIRKRSILNFKEAGLKLGTCVEPIGPEHTNEELADMIKFCASINPGICGAARRISIPGTGIANRGMIGEWRLAQIIAITRLAMPKSVEGIYSVESMTMAAFAGANVLLLDSSFFTEYRYI